MSTFRTRLSEARSNIYINSLDAARTTYTRALNLAMEVICFPKRIATAERRLWSMSCETPRILPQPLRTWPGALPTSFATPRPNDTKALYRSESYMYVLTGHVLTYPITMLLIGILYVVLIMIESMRLRLPLWREKALPTLLYGFNDETQRLLRERQGYGRTKKEDTNVRFNHDGEKGCLRLMTT